MYIKSICFLLIFLSMHLIFICVFLLQPFKVNREEIIGKSTLQMYQKMGEPTHIINEKGFIAWENCSLLVCKNIEVRMDGNLSDFVSEKPVYISLSNSYNGKAKYLKMTEVVCNGVVKKYMAVWSVFIIQKRNSLLKISRVQYIDPLSL